MSAGSHTVLFVGIDTDGQDNTAFIDDVCILAQNAGIWSLGTLDAWANASVVFQATVTTDVPAATTIANTASLSCAELPTPVASNAVSFTVSSPDLTVTAVSVPPAAWTDTPCAISWSVENIGSAALLNGWTDQVYLSPDTQVADGWLLGTFPCTASLAPAQSVTIDNTVSIPRTGIVDGAGYYLIVVTNADHAVVESNTTNDTLASAQPMVVHLSKAADLTVSQVQVTQPLWEDRACAVSWTIANIGQASTNIPWSDRVVVTSLDGQTEYWRSDPIPTSQALANGAQLQRIEAITIPSSAIPADGTYLVEVLTNTDAPLVIESDYTNNSASTQALIQQVPLPNLVVANITSPATAYAGSTIFVQATIANIGNGPTNANGWYDWFFLGPNPLPEWLDPVRVQLPNVGPLAPGQSYVTCAELTLPITLSGTYYVIMYADSDGAGVDHYGWVNNVKETCETDNYGIANPIQILIPPLPDLKVSGVQAQLTAWAGDTVPVSWQVVNQGAVSTQAGVSWVDNVYLSQNTTLDNSAILLATLPAPLQGPLAPNQGYDVTTSSQVVIPNNISPGTWYVLVKTDAQDQVYVGAQEADKVSVNPPAIQLNAAPAELMAQIDGATVSGTTQLALTVNWTVTNYGAFSANTAGGWLDRVYLSTSPTLDATAITLGALAQAGPLDPGDSYSATQTYTLPSCIHGQYYLFVVTDAANQVVEYYPGTDSNVSAAVTVPLVLYTPDLRVTALSCPATGAAGSPLPVTWTVNNAGNAAAAAPWQDAVYLSPTSTFDAATAQLLGSVTQTATLASGDSYSAGADFPLPTTAKGAYYLIIQVDSATAVLGCAPPGVNIGVSTNVLMVSNTLPAPSLPALQVTTLAAPASAYAGATITVNWQDTNTGSGAMSAPADWNDAIYLSTTTTLTADAILLGNLVVHDQLACNASHTASTTVTLPVAAQGTMYLIVVCDSTNQVSHGPGQNNSASATTVSVLTPDVNLQVTEIDAANSALAGQTLQVNWQVTNTGSAATLSSAWTDEVLLSRDMTFDPSDTQLGWLRHTGALGAGQSYNAGLQVLIPPGLGGPYYLIVVTDWNHEVAETNVFDNNSIPYPLQVEMAAPIDLTVTAVAAPPIGIPANPSTFPGQCRISVRTTTAAHGPTRCISPPMRNGTCPPCRSPACRIPAVWAPGKAISVT